MLFKLKDSGVHIDVRVRIAWVLFYVLPPMGVLIARGVFSDGFGDTFADFVGCPSNSKDKATCALVLLLVRYGFALFLLECLVFLILT